MRAGFVLTTVTVCAAPIVAAAVIAPVGTSAATAAEPGTPSPCVAEYEKTVRPDLVLVGEAVSVTMHVHVVCPGEVYPLHVALVLDASASMAGPSERQMRDAAEKMVKGMALSEAAARRGAVVQFGRATMTGIQMSGDEARVLNAVRRVQARPDPSRGGPGPPVTVGPPVTSVPHTPAPGATPVPDGDVTVIDRGIFDGHRELVAARRLYPYPENISEAMVVMSDGQDPRGCRPALQEARNVKADGVLVVAICVGHCDEGCMRQVASSPRYYVRAENAGALAGIFQQIRDRIVGIAVKRLVIEETPAEDLAYVPDSAVPPPDEIEPSSGMLRWDVPYLPREGITVTYRSRALAQGYRQVAKASSCWFEDFRGRRGGFPFPTQWVSAWQPDELVAPRFGLAPDPRPPIATPVVPRPLPTVVPAP